MSSLLTLLYCPSFITARYLSNCEKICSSRLTKKEGKVKGFVTELTPLHVQSAWRFGGKNLSGEISIIL